MIHLALAVLVVWLTKLTLVDSKTRSDLLASLRPVQFYSFVALSIDGL